MNMYARALFLARALLDGAEELKRTGARTQLKYFIDGLCLCA